MTTWTDVVLTLIGNAVIAVNLVLVLKGKYGMMINGFLLGGLLVWLPSAIRLARPGSVWARTLYDPTRAAKAAERFSDRRSETWPPPPAPPRPAVPNAVRCGLALLALAALLNLFSPVGVARILCGSVAVLVVFARRGRSWARTAALSAAAAPAILAIAVGAMAVVPAGPIPGLLSLVVVLIAGWLLSGAATGRAFFARLLDVPAGRMA